jgi:hypothetical protein
MLAEKLQRLRGEWMICQEWLILTEEWIRMNTAEEWLLNDYQRMIPSEEQTRMADQRLSRMSDLPRMTDLTEEWTRITDCKTDQERMNG